LKTSTSRKSTATAKTKKAAAATKTKTPVARTANLDRAIKDYEDAMKLMARGDYAKASQAFQHLLKEYPMEREVCDRSRIYTQICKVRMAPAHTKARGPEEMYYMGVMAANDGRLDDAADLLDKASKDSPQDDRTFYALAAVNALRGDKAGAVGNMGKAIGINPANRTLALNDDDFDTLAEDAEFSALLGRPVGTPA
jgi:tetratricopeptide (TPR) repeat protein